MVNYSQSILLFFSVYTRTHITPLTIKEAVFVSLLELTNFLNKRSSNLDHRLLFRKDHLLHLRYQRHYFHLQQEDHLIELLHFSKNLQRCHLSFLQILLVNLYFIIKNIQINWFMKVNKIIFKERK